MRERSHARRWRAAVSLAAATLTCAGICSSVLAGPRYTTPGVQILRFADNSGSAEGTLGGTRNSANTVERISCVVSRKENLSSAGALLSRETQVTCFARDADGRAAACSSESDTIANALNGLSNDGLLRFAFNSKAQCTDILVYASSSLERKQ